MPRRRRAATASANNGKMSGEGKSAKRQKVDGPEMGNAGDKEVSPLSFQLFHKLSHHKNTESCSKTTSRGKDGRRSIFRVSTSIRGTPE
jgi:hypothetical protein